MTALWNFGYRIGTWVGWHLPEFVVRALARHRGLAPMQSDSGSATGDDHAGGPE